MTIPADAPAGARCFVIMPIGSPGTERHDTFLAIYEQMFRDPLTAAGFKVVRADEVEDSGSISSDIVKAIAESDLVLADLTDLNANVFYELGVRHALVQYGTIMVANADALDAIPFDIKSYRVLTYRPDLKSLQSFKASLDGFLGSFRSARADRRDNPVHDTFPVLPRNAVQAAGSDAAGELRAEIARLTDIVRNYELRFPPSADTRRETVADAVSAAQTLFDSGTHPSALLRTALQAVDAQSPQSFLPAIAQIVVGDGSGLAANDFRQLANGASKLDLDDVRLSILQFAVESLPDDESLQDGYLVTLCHSPRREDRERAVETLTARVGLMFADDGCAGLQAVPSRGDLTKISLICDALHSNASHDQALAVTSALIEVLPGNARALRLHARALENLDRDAEGLGFYQEALASSDVDGTVGLWLGNTMHNNGRFVDAAESYAVSCLVDLNSAHSFGMLLEALLNAMYASGCEVGYSGRQLPEVITSETLEILFDCFASCSSVTMAYAASIYQERPKAASLGFDGLLERIDSIGAGALRSVSGFKTLGERRDVVVGCYTPLRSVLTEMFDRVTNGVTT